MVSLKGLTYLRRNAELRQAVKTLLNDRAAQGMVQQLQLSSGEVFFAQAEALGRTLPRLSNRMVILSPFDNSVIQRERLKTLFNYDYQIECYVPAARRQYGYFCLPLLYRDAFVGRMDCKARRKEKLLEIKALHFEPHSFDDGQVATAFATAISKFCQFQGCDRVSLTDAYPKQMSLLVRKALAQ